MHLRPVVAVACRKRTPPDGPRSPPKSVRSTPDRGPGRRLPSGPMRRDPTGRPSPGDRVPGPRMPGRSGRPDRFGGPDPPHATPGSTRRLDPDRRGPQLGDRYPGWRQSVGRVADRSHSCRMPSRVALARRSRCRPRAALPGRACDQGDRLDATERHPGWHLAGFVARHGARARRRRAKCHPGWHLASPGHGPGDPGARATSTCHVPLGVASGRSRAWHGPRPRPHDQGALVPSRPKSSSRRTTSSSSGVDTSMSSVRSIAS